MRPLVIDAEARKRIAYAVRYANHNPLRRVDLEALQANHRIVSEDPHRIVFLDFGYRVVLTIEEGDDGVWRRRLCVHLANLAERLPNPAAVKAIAQAFGFNNPEFSLNGTLTVKEPISGNKP